MKGTEEWRDEALKLRGENERLRELLRVAHVAALQGGYNTSDPDDQADMRRVRQMLQPGESEGT